MSKEVSEQSKKRRSHSKSTSSKKSTRSVRSAPVTRTPTHGALACPEYDVRGNVVNPQSTRLVVDASGLGQCVPPNFMNDTLKSAKREVTLEAKRHYKRDDIADLVSPYTVNLAQRNQLAHILGKDNVNEMEMLNALSYSGLVNSTCPPIHQPHKTEQFIDLISGKMSCRAPEPARKLIRGVMVNGCPNKYGDPKALEHYIDAFGTGVCRRPVIRGKFFCPDPSNPLAVKHVTLPDGTGICIQNSVFRKPFVMPKRLVYPSDINTDCKEFLQLYSDVDIDYNSIVFLNKLFTNGNKSIDEIRGVLETDPTSVINNEVVKRLRSLKSVKHANYALIHYFRETDPENYKLYVGTPDKYLKVLGLSKGIIDLARS